MFQEMEDGIEGLPSAKRAAFNRLFAGVLGVALTTAIGTAGVLAVYYPLRNAETGVQWLLVFGMMTLESAAVHLPSEVILPVGGWQLVRDGDLGVAGVLGLSAVAGLGNTMGSFLLYLAGRTGGRPLVRRFGRYFLVHERDLVRFPIPPFLAITFAGSFLWCLPFVALGAVLGENWEVIEGPAKIVGIAVLALFIGVLLVALVRQLRRQEAAG